MNMYPIILKRKQQRLKCLLAVGILTAFVLTGCRSNVNTDTNNAETEALKQQIARLEQQIASLEQQVEENDNVGKETIEETSAAVESSVQEQTDAVSDNRSQTVSDTLVGNNFQSQADVNAESSQQASQVDAGAVSLTTYTMEELRDMVDTFVTKAGATTPSGTASQDLEQFFALKQEEKRIDDTLDRHEDELESLYRKNVLARDEYKRLERELELLEDQLDDMEDQLEYVFGIDD